MLSILARATHVQYVNVMVPSTIVVVIFVGSLVYNLYRGYTLGILCFALPSSIAAGKGYLPMYSPCRAAPSCIQLGAVLHVV